MHNLLRCGGDPSSRRGGFAEATFSGAGIAFAVPFAETDSIAPGKS
jgi:hypothetical protein